MVDPTLNIIDLKHLFSDVTMLWIFFFYGLGFLILAGVVFFKKRKLVDVDLTKSFYFLGLFGLIHGITEWIDFSRLFIKINYNGMQLAWLNISKVVFLVVSFLLLLQFGINMLTITRPKLKFFRWLPLVAGIVFFVYTLYFNILGSSELLARYCFGFTGSLLSSLALLGIVIRTKDGKLVYLRASAITMFIAFFVYTIFGGLITFSIFGVPPQLIRMLCALVVAFASFNFLGILESGLGRKK